MTATALRTVEVVLARARVLVDGRSDVESAIETLESLRHRLEPADAVARQDRALEQLRSRLASHLVALQAVRDAEASVSTVARVVRRAIADVEDRLAAVQLQATT